MTIQEIIESIDYCLECDNDRIPTTQEDLRTIKEALEKQVPKKPVQLDENRKKAVEKRKRNDVTTLQVLELRQQGKTYGEVAKELNCDKSTVWRRLSKINQNRLE